MKKWTAALALFLAVTAMPVSAAAKELVAGGRTVGIQMTTDGVVVSQISKVETSTGTKSPAEEAGVEPGDVITRLGSADIHSAEDFTKAVGALDGSATSVTVTRNGKSRQLNITPCADENGKLRLGLWLRDGVSGVGTVTFYDPESGVYGALGHGITDGDTGVLLPLGEGSVSKAEITGVIKGKSGTPGQLSGCSDEGSICGSVCMNTEYGIFGFMDAPPEGGAMECGEIKTGRASIISTVSGAPAREYEVEINRVYHNSDGERVMLTVTDSSLISATGGIVQGMSGSPILQDGKLVGAVTHVFINDPTKGYGLSIQDMIAQAQACADKAA